MAAEARIHLEHVGVRYQAPADQTRSLKEYVVRRLKGQPVTAAFWALRGVSLEIRRGESVGIIGRNGAGKSTLLKTISRVIRPTSGRVWVRGRLAPLLDVGAGFHPELTGRENVYLNATLLGHPRREVDERLATIAAFSELEAFFDAPVRTYSSGMVARLGFAVATAWNPDVLLLDEVLAVGDERFREKSAQRVAEMREQASTVLLVSHGMDTIQALCHRAVWLDQGKVRADGAPADVIALYRQG